jgi:CubicO group peptidase (beta-lactamase class C family)
VDGVQPVQKALDDERFSGAVRVDRSGRTLLAEARGFNERAVAVREGGARRVVLAILAERLTGTPFADLVTERVCRPARMLDTAFLRSDELPGRTARGYLDPEGLRTNVLHLPVRGSGDGGLYSTLDDVHSLWQALFDGRIVSPDRVADLIAPRSDAPDHGRRYGLGFWLHRSGDGVLLEGYDAGVSFMSAHEPSSDLTWTVVSNTSEGAWPLARHLTAMLS